MDVLEGISFVMSDTSAKEYCYSYRGRGFDKGFQVERRIVYVNSSSIWDFVWTFENALHSFCVRSLSWQRSFAAKNTTLN